jgi:glycosyltransferase involved in cell wall biosynthesis
MKIGVAISTFNRPDFLDITLWHWNQYSNELVEIVVIDDGSNRKIENQNVCNKYPKVRYVFQENQGISKTKTKGLSEIKQCDYVFLSDDDCFPIKNEYWIPFIESYSKTGNHHFMYLIDNINGHVIHGPKNILPNGVESYNNCGGMLLFATHDCINKVGGFDNRMKFYGYEHAQWSIKIHSNGFTTDGKYLSLPNLEEYFFSVDFDYGWRGKIPQYWNPDIVMQSSITTTEEKKNGYKDSISYNSQYMNDLNFYTPL